MCTSWSYKICPNYGDIRIISHRSKFASKTFSNANAWEQQVVLENGGFPILQQLGNNNRCYAYLGQCCTATVELQSFTTSANCQCSYLTHLHSFFCARSPFCQCPVLHVSSYVTDCVSDHKMVFFHCTLDTGPSRWSAKELSKYIKKCILDYLDMQLRFFVGDDVNFLWNFE